MQDCEDGFSQMLFFSKWYLASFKNFQRRCNVLQDFDQNVLVLFSPLTLSINYISTLH